MSKERRTTAVVSLDDEGSRFDVFLAACPGINSRGQAQRLIKAGRALIDEEVKPKDYSLRIGQQVSYEVPERETLETAVPEKIPLDIVFEDNQIIIVNKPHSLVVHPAAGNYHGTLVNGLLAHTSLATIGTPLRPGIVHRLDKDTSGLMVVAKTDFAYMSLIDQIRARTMGRRYLVLVEGGFKNPRGRIEAPIKRSSRDRKAFTVAKTGGKEAVTEFEVIASVDKYSLLDVSLLTGRTHQIRVHMRYINHPVIGDQTYGSLPGKKARLNRQWLHSYRLALEHPGDGKRMSFAVPPPGDLVDFLEKKGIPLAPALFSDSAD